MSFNQIISPTGNTVTLRCGRRELVINFNKNIEDYTVLTVDGEVVSLVRIPDNFSNQLRQLLYIGEMK